MGSDCSYKVKSVCPICRKTTEIKKGFAWHLRYFYWLTVWEKCEDCAKKDLTTVE